MKIIRCKTNRMTDPIGFELGTPRLSWVVEESRGKKQRWARITVGCDPQLSQLLFDSGEDADADSLAYTLPIQLTPQTRYFWKVVVCDDLGDLAESEVNVFETGMMGEKLQGKMIAPDLPYDVAPYLCKTFRLAEKPTKARAYFTGLGVYELYLNGEKVGDEFLAPGCDRYDKWLQLQTYDVTHLLQVGENTVGAMIGNGWAKGRFGFDGKAGCFETGEKGQPSDIFTESYMLLGDLVIWTPEGEQVISTDESWRCAPSPVVFSGIYDGEKYDARKEIENWCAPSADHSGWQGVKPYEGTIGQITDRLSLPVKKMAEFQPELILTPKGEYVLDVKQEISGWMEFYCDVPAGTELRLQYGEILQDECFYRDNLRSALSEYRFVSAGKPKRIRPMSTFYGFRYVKVTGLEKVNPADFTACALYSQMETIGNIVTANEKVNRLFQNCLWSQRDNFVDVPTDCPQRDERMGWTGDAQVFCPTANFNMDCLPFYKKYGRDLYIDQQMYEGRVTHVSPMMVKEGEMLTQGGGACGWADAATVVPWMTYLFTGDISILEAQYASMVDWAEWIYRHDEAHGSTRLWLETTMHFGDWLALDGARSGFDPEAVIGGTDNTFLCSVYYFYSTLLVAKAAKALGKEAASQKYFSRAEEIKAAIRNEFFTPGGRCAAATQTGNALSLHFDIAPENAREKVLGNLVRLIHDNNDHLKTGFLGTPFLCRALSNWGANDLAYTLFLQEDLPGWLYEVNMGATTIWERWNAILPDGKISGIGMNSMNHYAYGAIIEWVYRNVCGINPREDAPGFRKIDLRPQPDRRLRAAKAEYSSPAGQYRSSWRYEGEQLTYEFEVPFGAEAHLYLPLTDLKEKTINGAAIQDDTALDIVLEAGRYVVK